MGRFFNDGHFYEAKVVTQPEKVFDLITKKFVLSRKIKYDDDGQEEWADEKQLNDWAITDREENDDERAIADGNEKDDESCDDYESSNVVSSSSVCPVCPVPVVTPSSDIAPRSLFPLERENRNSGSRRSTRKRRQTVSFHASNSSDVMGQSLPIDGSIYARNTKQKKNGGIVKKTKEEARHALLFKMGITEEEVDFALEQMSPPYSLNEAIKLIHNERENRIEDKEEAFTTGTKFDPKIGFRVRVNMGGSTYYGSVTDGPHWKTPEGAKKAVKMWTVTYENDEENTTDDMDWNQLFQNRASRSIIRHKNLRKRRPLNALELFSGEGIVTQEFCDLKFNVKSIDANPESYASMVLDIFRIKYEDIGFVPDFVWASPPCTTYTNLTGGYHRNASAGQYEKTAEAYDQSLLLASTMCLMRWAKEKNPHLVVVFENPQAQLQKMPMMIEFEKNFGLYKATCHYCALGRPDKKPTNLWTNVSFSTGKFCFHSCSVF